MGPCAAIWLPRRLVAAETAAVRADVAAISERVADDEFWVGDTRPIGGRVAARPRPFAWSIGFDPFVEADALERELTEVAACVGWRPGDQLAFFAGRDDATDHQVLAEICVRIAARLDGVVELDRVPPWVVEVRAALAGPDVYSHVDRDAGGASAPCWDRVLVGPGALRRWLGASDDAPARG